MLRPRVDFVTELGCLRRIHEQVTQRLVKWMNALNASKHETFDARSNELMHVEETGCILADTVDIANLERAQQNKTKKQFFKLWKSMEKRIGKVVVSSSVCRSEVSKNTYRIACCSEKCLIDTLWSEETTSHTGKHRNFRFRRS